MIALTFDWHPFWISYEWWRDIGTGLMSVATAAIVGGTTIAVAVRSQRMARSAQDVASSRDEKASVDRYRDQIVRVVEPAVSALVAYGNAVNSSSNPDASENNQLRADALSRVILLKAVANAVDSNAVEAIRKTFASASTHKNKRVRVHVTGRLAEKLAELVSVESSRSELIKSVEGSIQAQEQHEARKAARKKEAQEEEALRSTSAPAS